MQAKQMFMHCVWEHCDSCVIYQTHVKQWDIMSMKSAAVQLLLNILGGFLVMPFIESMEIVIVSPKIKEYSTEYSVNFR